MAAIEVNYSKLRNPELRDWVENELVDVLFATVDGHDHDGANSKALSPETVIAEGSVGTSAIINLAVTTGKLAADAVTGAKLADGAVDSEHIVAGSIDTAHIANDQVTNDKLANITRGSIKVGGDSNAPTDYDAKGDGKILVGDGTDVKSVAVFGDVTLANTGAVTIGAAKITTAMLGLTTTPNAKAIAAAHEAAIPVTGNGIVALTIEDAAETNTLDVPTFAGQEITIAVDTLDGLGTRAITGDADIDSDGNNVITFTGAGQMVVLRGIKLGASFAWRLVANDGATLS